MYVIILMIIFVFSLLILMINKKHSFYLALFLQLGTIVITTYWAIIASVNGSIPIIVEILPILNHSVRAEIDDLSAFFILVINFTMLTGMIFSKGYLKGYLEEKTNIEIGLHYFSFLWLHFSMLLVCMIRDTIPFLVVWEIMSVASFILVIFESEKSEIIKTGIKYLIQMHIGLIFIMVAFLIVNSFTLTDGGFNGLEEYFSKNSPILVFLLFFVGFGIKAGFIPLHTWLSHAHPAAPSHVSGVMSGIMIKMGIYGILRVLFFIHLYLLEIGSIILIVSVISGVFGVIMAIAQHDIKKLLAYHSIENIGIIGIGIGLGVIGIGLNLPVLATLGFAGGILHVFNHSLFKSLLFYTAGNVYSRTHTRDINFMGGLFKKMPKTALLFLLGSLAICGLPPFNGFISEFLIYKGLFDGLSDGSLNADLLMIFAIVGLALIGGLAVFCFTKVFSIVFLGNDRKIETNNIKEVSGFMLFPNLLIAIIILAIGLVPFWIIQPLNQVVYLFTHNSDVLPGISSTFNKISIISIVFIGIICGLWFLRNLQHRKTTKKKGTTWGCAYTGANLAIHQYTATSYANNLKEYSNFIMNIDSDNITIQKDEIFPAEREYHSHSSDVFEKIMILKPVNKLLGWLEKIAVFQTGKLQHYLLYSLAFMFFMFLLSVFKII